MEIKQNISRTIALTRWKVAHELKLMKLREKLRETEGNISREKLRLGEITYELFQNKKIIDDTLLKVCTEIQELDKSVNLQKIEIDITTSETPPEADNVSSEQPTKGLRCPKCSSSIPVRYCPKCGADSAAFTSTIKPKEE